MFRESWLRWVMLACGLLLFIFGYVIALALELPVGPESWIKNVRAIDSSRAETWIKAIGLVFSILSGSSAIYHAWYFAERNLPERLDAYLESKSFDLKSDRDLFLRAVARRQGDTGVSPKGSTASGEEAALQGLLQRLNKPASSEKALLLQLQDSAKVSTRVLEASRHETATVHLVRGLLIAQQGLASNNARELELAAELLEKALEFDPGAMEAFESLAQIWLHEKDFARTLEIATRWELFAERASKGRDCGKAKLCRARVRVAQPAVPDNVARRTELLNEARDVGTAGVNSLVAHPLAGTPSELDRELADAHRFVGEVRSAIGTALPTARSHCGKALKIYQALGDKEAVRDTMLLLGDINDRLATQNPAVTTVTATLVRGSLTMSRAVEEIGQDVEAQAIVIRARMTVQRASDKELDANDRAILAAQIDARLEELAELAVRRTTKI